MIVFILDHLNVPVHLNRLHTGNPGFAVRWLCCSCLFFFLIKGITLGKVCFMKMSAYIYFQFPMNSTDTLALHMRRDCGHDPKYWTRKYQKKKIAQTHAATWICARQENHFCVTISCLHCTTHNFKTQVEDYSL